MTFIQRHDPPQLATLEGREEEEKHSPKRTLFQKNTRLEGHHAKPHQGFCVASVSRARNARALRLHYLPLLRQNRGRWCLPPAAGQAAILRGGLEGRTKREFRNLKRKHMPLQTHSSQHTLCMSGKNRGRGIAATLEDTSQPSVPYSQNTLSAHTLHQEGKKKYLSTTLETTPLMTCMRQKGCRVSVKWIKRDL